MVFSLWGREFLGTVLAPIYRGFWGVRQLNFSGAFAPFSFFSFVGINIPIGHCVLGYFALFWVVIFGFWVVFSHKVMVFSCF